MRYSEADIRAIYIDPALQESSWKPFNIKREFYFKYSEKNKEARVFVDYLLVNDNAYLAIIEAKRWDKKVNSGLQKAILYATKLQVRFVYAANGKEIYEFDMSSGKGKIVPNFPTLEELLAKIMMPHVTLEELLRSTPLNHKNKPHQYQNTAIENLIESIAQRNKRALIRMSPGTGKTYVVFQVLYKLIKSKWNIEGADRNPRVLFLSDRREIVEQSAHFFNQFAEDIAKVIITDSNNLKFYPESGVFFSTYQLFSFRKKKLELFRKFSKSFFDIIIADEYHKPSISKDGKWNKILLYFDHAIQIGISSFVPIERLDEQDTYEVPVFEYSIKDAIEDNVLATPKIYRIAVHKDSFFNSELEPLLKRISSHEEAKFIAKGIIELIGTKDKTIVYCKNQVHALQISDAINEIKGLDGYPYCVRVTSADGDKGKDLLDRFARNIDGSPTILTTAKLLTTGFDIKEIRNIVICRPIHSLIELLQIIQRGARRTEGKDYFNVFDFTRATDLLYKYPI
jgi:type I restriction enzyme R subunit